jgi:hypothetical protein
MSNDLAPQDAPSADPPPPAERPPTRRRVSRRRYLLRRVVVFGVAVVALVGVVGLVSALFGGADEPATATDVSSVVSVDTTTEVPPSVVDTVTPETAAPPSTDPAPVVPSAATPAKVLILGDSDAGTFGPYLQTLMDQTGIVTSALDYKVSSGLSRPDFFDWPSHLDTVLAQEAPDIVVVTFGGNDAQPLTDVTKAVVAKAPTGEPGGDAEWRAEYGRRVAAIIDELAAGGRTVIWVGIPNAVDPDFTARLKVQDETVRSVVAERTEVQFVDTWARFSGREGNYAEFVIDPRDGLGKDVRAEDGFHLNVNGAEILALDIAEVLRAELRARGAAI